MSPSRASLPPPTDLCRLRNTLRHAWSDLAFRPFLLCVCLGAVLVAASDLWLLGGLGAGVHRGRSEELAAEEPARLTLLPPPGDARAAFTPELLDELRRLPSVAAAGPKLEIYAWASLGTRAAVLAPVEGRVSARALPAEALAGGRDARLGEEAALLTQSLFERLGGVLLPDGPRPAALTLRLGRTVGGEDQEHDLCLPIAGVLRRQHDPDRIDVPLALAAELDRWCLGEDVPGMPERPAPRSAGAEQFDGVDLLVARDSIERLPDELAALALAGERLDERGRDPVVASASSGETRGAGPAQLCVTARRADGEPLDRAAVARLEVARPTVRAVRPFAAVAGSWLGGEALECAGCAPGDEGFLDLAFGLEAGRWPAGGREIALPAARAAELGLDPAALLGREVELSVGAASGATCELQLVVCGLAGGERAFLPAEIAEQLAGFRRGVLRFGPHGFAPVAARPERGHAAVRATLEARDLESVAPLASHLRSRYGFLTVDRAAEHAALLRLGRGLALLVAALVAGCLAVAAGTVLGMTAQKIHARLFEIGLLRAHGVPAAQIVLVHAAEGLFLGALAFAAALALQLLCAERLRALLAAAFDVPERALDPGSALGPPVLVVAVIAVCLVFPVLGTAVPAWWACRRISTVEALRRRD